MQLHTKKCYGMAELMKYLWDDYSHLNVVANRVAILSYI